MTLYAFDDIDDAIDATRAFLLPFDLGRWAKLALVVFFLGGSGAGANPFQYNVGGSPTAGPGPDDGPDVSDLWAAIGPDELALILAVVAVVVVIGLVFLLIGSIMEFVFVESLSRERVSILGYGGARWRQGVRLFGFRLVLGLLTIGVFAGLGFLALEPLIFGTGAVSIELLVVAVLAFVVLSIVIGLVTGFTTVFVVPIMIAEDRGVLSGWRRLWPTMTGQWKQYLVYAVMGFVLQIAAGIVAGILIVLIAVVLLIPFGIVGLAGAGLLSVSSLAGWIVIGLVALAFLLTVLVVALFINVPIQTFLRYYALFVLGDTNEDFDIIGERRRAVRA